MPEVDVISKSGRRISIHPTTTVAERLNRPTLVAVGHSDEVGDDLRENKNYRVVYDNEFSKNRGLAQVSAATHSFSWGSLHPMTIFACSTQKKSVAVFVGALPKLSF